MTMTTARDVTTIPRIGHDEAMRIASAENAKFATLMRNIAPEDWSKPTDCTLWDVRAMAAHVVGSAAGQVSPREFLRQKRKGKPVTAEIGGQFWWDGMNEVQVRERADLTTEQLIAEWESTYPKAVKARTKLPKPIANLKVLKLPMPEPIPLPEEERVLPASYANFYIGNDVVLVPVFDDASDKEAVDTIRGCFPSRRTVPIYAKDLVYGYGGFHRVTQQEPAVEKMTARHP
jgi:hypothetical protein